MMLFFWKCMRIHQYQFSFGHESKEAGPLKNNRKNVFFPIQTIVQEGSIPTNRKWGHSFNNNQPIWGHSMISIFHFSYFYLGSTKYSFWVPLYQGGGDVLQWPQGSKLQSSWSIKMSNSCTLCSSSFRPNSPSISHPLSHNGSPLRMEEGGIWSWSTTLPTF